jgi:hypothetical protein
MLKIDLDGLPTLINLSLVTRASFDSSSKELRLPFAGHETIELIGEEAERAWRTLLDEEAIEDIGDWDLKGLREQADADFARMEGEMNRIRKDINDGKRIDTRAANFLRIRIDALDSHTLEDIGDSLRGKLQALKEQAYLVADEAEIAAYVGIIQECLKKPIRNSASAKAFIRRILDSEERLRNKNGFSDEIKATARQGKERAVWYRAQKKLKEAEVAGAGRSFLKQEKYKREAAALLGQDWEFAFPDEKAPTIEVA